MIVIASDHAALEMKEQSEKCLQDRGETVQDLGACSTERVDYCDFGFRADVVRYIGIGLVNVIYLDSSEMVCISGGISDALEPLLEPLVSFVRKNMYENRGQSNPRMQIGSGRACVPGRRIPAVPPP